MKEICIVSAELKRHGHINCYDEEDKHYRVPPAEAHEQQVSLQVRRTTWSWHTHYRWKLYFHLLLSAS
jgi:hypothetical protein